MEAGTLLGFRKIREAYESRNLEAKFTGTQKYKSGLWRPTRFGTLDDEVAIIGQLHRTGKVDHNGKTLEIGSGDHRRLAYLNNQGFRNLVGIENYPDICREGDEILDDLASQGVINRGQIRTFVGNGLGKDIYEQIEIPFSDFDNIFSYLAKPNEEKLIEKIEKESKNGALFFALRHSDSPYIGVHSLIEIHEQLLGPDEQFYLQVFRKTSQAH